MKKPSRRTILVHAIALYGESFRWATVFTEYELLMQISKSTRHALESYATRTQLVPDTHSICTRLALENVERVRRYLRAVPYITQLFTSTVARNGIILIAVFEDMLVNRFASQCLANTSQQTT